MSRVDHIEDEDFRPAVNKVVEISFPFVNIRGLSVITKR
jgi:hypothetical protein